MIRGRKQTSQTKKSKNFPSKERVHNVKNKNKVKPTKNCDVIVLIGTERIAVEITKTINDRG